MTTTMQLDTLDDRREIHRLLSRLSPAQRIAFVAGVCSRVSLKGSQARPRVAQKTHDLAALARWDDSADKRLNVDLYFDLFHLANHYQGFCWDDVLARLVLLARGKA